MLDGGKGLIEVVQQLAPLLVVLRTAKAHGVVLQAVPFHEQQVGARALQAPRQCQAPEAGHTHNDLLGLPEGGLEVILVARSDRQQRMLESHFAMVAAVAVGPAVRGAAPRDVNTPVSQRDRYPGRCSSRRWRSAARPRRRRAAGSRHEHRRRRHTNLPDRAGGSGSGDPSTAPVLGRPRRTKRVRARRRPTHSAQPHCGSVVVQRSPGSATRATARVHAPLPHSTLIGNARMVAPIAGTAVRLASFSICR